MKLQVKPRKEPQQARSKAMVDTILDATARVLVRESYAKASTNAIAEAAGISVGSLYQYFPNKDSLITALHGRHVAQVHDAFVSITARPERMPLPQAVKAIINAVVEAHLVEPDLHKVLESEVPHLLRFESTHEKDFEAAIYEFTRRHRDEISVKNLKMASFVVGQMVHALVHAAVIEQPEELSVAAIERETVRAVLAYLTSAPV